MTQVPSRIQVGSKYDPCATSAVLPTAEDRLGISLAYFCQLPTASVTHFLVKLALAAPANFFSAADFSHVAFASVSHFFMKLVIAAPASFLVPASILQESA